MILIIDNYDSFVYNLARYFARAGFEYQVVRNDEVTLQEIKNLRPEALVLSPGPCTPAETGICIEAIQRFGSTMPILGVCLGHQCIGEAYGGKTVRTDPVHGKASKITHTGDGLFSGLPARFDVGRYHSLSTELPENGALVVDAQTDAGDIMAFHHKAFPVYGVQFHPESILTEHGLEIVKSFSKIVRVNHKQDLAA